MIVTKVSYVKSVAALILVLFIGLSGVPPANQLNISEVWVGQSHVQTSNIIANDDIIDTLPSASISLFLEKGPLSTGINATLTFGFSQNDWLYNYNIISVGYIQEYLSVSNGIGAVPVVGLGYDEMREYPFMYFNTGVFLNHWVNRTPVWTSFRPYPAWTEEFGVETYTGMADPDKPSQNASQIITAGDIIEFENLTVYFEDDTSFVCGPRLIRVGVNFTQREERVWEVNKILEVSNETGVTIGGDSMTVVLQGQVPLHPVFLVTVVTIPITVTLVGIAIIYRRRRLKSHTTIE